MRKKILIAATVALLSLSSVSVMAANSPVASDYYNITIGTTVGTTDSATIKVTGGSITTSTGAVEVNKEVTLTATADKGYTFTEWKIEGTYTIVSGSLTSTSITVIPASDLNVNANFPADVVETTTVAETTTAVETTTVATETTTAVETTTVAVEEPSDEEEIDEPDVEDEETDEPDVEDEEETEDSGLSNDGEDGTTVAPDSSTTSPQTGLPVAGVLVTLLASGGVAISAKKRF